MGSVTLQDDPSVESFFNVVETEAVALFEHLSFGFLEEFDVFASAERGSSHYICASLSLSPTMNAETIREARSSRWTRVL